RGASPDPAAMRLTDLASRLRADAVIAVKQALYFRRGEPYQVAGQTLRYLPGTRPVRLSHASSTNGINRYDALQIQALVDGLREGDTALDIGAHAGQYAVLMAALCGQAGRVV